MKKLIGVFIVLLFLAPHTIAGEMTLLSGLEEGSQGHKIGVGIASAVGKKIGVDFTFKTLPRKRLFHELQKNTGKYHGSLVNLDGLDARLSTVVKVQEPIITSPVVAVASKDIEINGWESLKPLKICHLLGFKIVEQNLAKHQLNSHPLNNVTQALKFVANGRSDIFLTAPALVADALKTDEFSALKIQKPPVAVYNFHTYFFKKNKEIAEKYNAALKSLKKDGTYMDILKSTQ